MEGNICFLFFQIYRTKGFEKLIAINKQEKEAIRERYPDIYIVRTMKQKSKRHRYYCVESPKVLRLLDRMRNPENFEREGGRYNSGKKR